MIAVQGPRARDLVLDLLEPGDAAKAEALTPFSAARLGSLFIARTGYTGEDGFEIAMPGEEAAACWKLLADAGVHPCGLGARDTLRLEAGMNLYGQDMDESVTPLECGLAWTVALQDDREFIGSAALDRQLEDGISRMQVGLVLEDRGVLRHGQRIVAAEGEGVVTSGSFSPTLERAIALARVPVGTVDRVQVDIRGKLLAARVVRPPFARRGAVCKGIL
jgi:aminomethyltransferase